MSDFLVPAASPLNSVQTLLPAWEIWSCVCVGRESAKQTLWGGGCEVLPLMCIHALLAGGGGGGHV